VPDGSMDAWRLALQFFASARALGADIRNFSEVIGLNVAAPETVDSKGQRRSRITGVNVRDYRSGEEYELKADLIINATGAWSKQVVGMAGIDIAVSPSPGSMVAVKGRLTNMVISHLHPAGDGDIIVPQRSLSIIGSTQWLAEDPDEISVPDRDIENLLRSAAKMVPAFKDADFHAAWAAPRPLVGEAGGAVGLRSLRELSRDFSLIDHGESDGVDRFLSIIGGKATTLRGMAEITADRACEQLGIRAVCRTAEQPLLPARSFYAARPRTSLEGDRTA
jgi:glycerol-3-phosphate dehydrogenase